MGIEPLMYGPLNLSTSILRLEVNFTILCLLVPHAHVIFKAHLTLDQIKLSDHLDEIVTAESLPVFLE